MASPTRFLDFSITNEYPELGSLKYYPWEYIVEPHKLSTLKADSAFNNDEDEGSTKYYWSISYKGETLHTAEGKATAFMFTEAGTKYIIELKRQVDLPSGPTIHVRHAEAMCKYVRRELRSLTDNDREAYFHAMEVVGRTPLKEGQKSYGDRYVSIGYETLKHVHGNDCSPYHGWLSFFTAHAAFTLELDAGLQAVNPSVIQPYWDFTVDSLELGNDWDQSQLFSDLWYGNATPSNFERSVDGRFSATPMTTSFDFSVHNPYGRVTDTRNCDPSPYVTRAHEFCGIDIDYPIPGCQELAQCLQTQNLVDLHDCSENVLHGNIHTVIGGFWDCKYSMKDYAKKYPQREELLLNVGVRSVNIWQKMNAGAKGIPGVMKCPSYCDEETPYDECRCSCPDYDHVSTEDLNTTVIKQVLSDMGVITWDQDELNNNRPDCNKALTSHYLYKKFMDVQETDDGGCDYKFTNMTSDENREFFVFLLNYACNPGKMGAMSTGAAANDPLFWPIHPLFDRLWAYIRLDVDGTFSNFNHTWVDDASCQGRSFEDIMPWKDLLDEGSGKFYTNEDLYDLFDPTNEKLTYVYEHFDWDHCSSFIENYSADNNRVW